MPKIPLSEIKMKRVFRKQLGDIEGLAESIKAVGLLHWIVVLSDYTLVCGRRRVEAFKRLERDRIDAHVAPDLASAEKYILAQRDENTCREDLAPSEAVAMGEAIEKTVKPKAEAAQKKGGRPRKTDGKKGGANCPNPPRDESARTTAVAAAAVNMSRRTYEKAKTVVDSGNEEAKKKMDESGKVDAAYKMVTGGNGNTAPKKKQVTVANLEKIEEGLLELESEVRKDRILISPAHIRKKVQELRKLVARLIDPKGAKENKSCSGKQDGK